MIKIQTPLTKDMLASLHAGDMVHITGTIYTARDAAHKKVMDMIQEGKELPFDIKDQIIYYVGPCPAKPCRIIGSAGPTTSSRMDAYSPKLIELGLKGMIGKGLRSPAVLESMKAHGAVYFGAIGGLGALIAKTIVAQEVIAFPELGTEAIRKLTVENFPAVVIVDCEGNNLYEIGKSRYRIV